MSTRSKKDRVKNDRVKNDRPDPARLFLVTPPIADATLFRPKLEAALAAADVACVLVRTAAPDARAAKAVLEALAPIVQEAGAALLVAGDHRLATRVAADGVHVAGIGADLDDALEALRPKLIVGVGALDGRDAAMAAGETGVDYVMFGGPDDPEDAESVLDRASWWAEIFNVPCVAYAHGPDRVAALARAGVEFVALCDGVWDDPAAILPAAARALAQADSFEDAPEDAVSR